MLAVIFLGFQQNHIDDIVRLVTTLRATSKMLTISNEWTAQVDIMFNDKTSKYVVYIFICKYVQ